MEDGRINFTKVGKHRRVRYEDVMDYRQQMKSNQKQLLVEMMEADEADGLYDT